jgi:hypothetical protein
LTKQLLGVAVIDFCIAVNNARTLTVIKSSATNCLIQYKFLKSKNQTLVAIKVGLVLLILAIHAT